MAENSKIEWTDHTFNPWVGCTKVGPGCDHCYAESWAKGAGTPDLWRGERRRTTVANWRKPVSWNKRQTDERQRVFCASLADVFDNAVPTEWRADLFALIRETPNLDWLLLTKRIGNAREMMLQSGLLKPLPNVWLGATVVNAEEVRRDLPKLLAVPAHIRFLSCEPLLSAVDLSPYLDGIHWVIAGGESGHHARPMAREWAERIRRDCAAAGVAFFMKQGSQTAEWGGLGFTYFEAFPEAIRIREFPSGLGSRTYPTHE